MRFLHRCTVLLLAFALVAYGIGTGAQDFPSRTIRLIVADAPGGAPDQLGRLLAEKLSEGVGQPVVVDNRAGAGGVVGADIAAKAPADGYT